MNQMEYDYAKKKKKPAPTKMMILENPIPACIAMAAVQNC